MYHSPKINEEELLKRQAFLGLLESLVAEIVFISKSSIFQGKLWWSIGLQHKVLKRGLE